MTKTSFSRDFWDWRCSVLVLIVAVTPVAALAWHSGDHEGFVVSAARLDGLVIVPATFAATFCLYVAWRISARPALAWLCTASAVIGLHGLTMSGMQIADSSHAFRQLFWMVVADVLILLTITVISGLLGRVMSRGEPIVIGLAAGLAVAVVRLLSVGLLPSVHVHLSAVQTALMVLLFLAPPVWVLLRADSLGLGARRRLAASVCLFGVAHLSTYLDGPHRSVVGSLATLGADLGASVLLVTTALAMLGKALGTEQREHDLLQQRVDELEERNRRDRARNHEVTATVVGVMSARRLVLEDPTLSAKRREMLEQMVDAELGRLERLFSTPVSAPRQHTVDLDATIGTVVLAHQARGQRVNWLPTGACVCGEQDDVAEVLNILLDNAAKHGSCDASVTVEARADAVEIAISDGGPGVAPEIRPHLFEWGARGPSSGGQGIGLHIAKDLTTRHGGYLRLRADSVHGATFVVGFPPAGRDDDEPAYVS